MYKKLKSFLADDAVFMALLMILVGIASFGLGRQSMMAKNMAISSGSDMGGVIFTEAASEVPQSTVTQLQVVASKSGTKYHLPNCPGASQIKEENKLYFDSPELAEAAGYTPAANCPGLQ
ncbi:hypothetical protein KC902_03745 [Candidatus Kaiserbacteria bacterium]|nr:hypothetical protein [Candidatus Kaiserbacteria bacterium]USN88775.1 MAG: hypothetical protein H6780_04785 [Candidatus Nomurabacteria bacterium]